MLEYFLQLPSSVTAKTAEQAGLKVDVMAEEYTVDGLIAALEKHFGR